MGTINPYTPKHRINILSKVIPAANWNGIQLNIGIGPILNTSPGEFGIGEITEMVVPLAVALS